VRGAYAPCGVEPGGYRPPLAERTEETDH
jgi:hypothetical protein